MKILVAGAGGQLGKDVARTLQARHEVYGFGHDQLDVTNLDIVMQVVQEIAPDVVINCSAYTAVDQAETDADQAFAVNAVGGQNVAMAAEAVGAKVCYISTDYVFDGCSSVPYKENDKVNPQGVYGKSKLAGEEQVKSVSSKFFIVRTSWLYGEFGSNFVKTMLRMAAERDTIKVVNDQIGSPTYSFDLAIFLSRLIETDKYGVYHATNSGQCSWYEFARAIFEEKRWDHIQVVPCKSEEFPRPAKRPQYSVLEPMAMRTNGFGVLRHWRHALGEFLK